MSYRLTEANRNHVAVIEETQFRIKYDAINNKLRLHLEDGDKLDKFVDLPSFDLQYDEETNALWITDPTSGESSKSVFPGEKYELLEDWTTVNGEDYLSGVIFRRKNDGQEKYINLMRLTKVITTQLKVNGDTDITGTLNADGNVTFGSSLEVTNNVKSETLNVGTSLEVTENDILVYNGWRVQNPDEMTDDGFYFLQFTKTDGLVDPKELKWGGFPLVTMTPRDRDGSPIDDSIQLTLLGMNFVVPKDPPSFASVGFDFIGWYYEETLDNLINWPLKSTANIDVWPYYKHRELTVSFNLNNGDDLPTEIVLWGNTVNNPGTDFEKEGFSFIGWFVKDNNSNTYVPYYFNNPVTDNLELEAHWKANAYTVTFILREGGVVTEFEVEPNSVMDPILIPGDPEEEGWKFLGWSSTNNTLTPFVFEDEIAEDTIVYSIWEEIVPQRMWGIMLPDGSDPSDFDIMPFTMEEFLQKYPSLNLNKEDARTAVDKDNMHFQDFGWILWICPMQHGPVTIIDGALGLQVNGQFERFDNILLDDVEYYVYKSVTQDLNDLMKYHFRYTN